MDQNQLPPDLKAKLEGLTPSQCDDLANKCQQMSVAFDRHESHASAGKMGAAPPIVATLLQLLGPAAIQVLQALLASLNPPAPKPGT